MSYIRDLKELLTDAQKDLSPSTMSNLLDELDELITDIREDLEEREDD